MSSSSKTQSVIPLLPAIGLYAAGGAATIVPVVEWVVGVGLAGVCTYKVLKGLFKNKSKVSKNDHEACAAYSPQEPMPACGSDSAPHRTTACGTDFYHPYQSQHHMNQS